MGVTDGKGRYEDKSGGKKKRKGDDGGRKEWRRKTSGEDRTR